MKKYIRLLMKGVPVFLLAAVMVFTMVLAGTATALADESEGDTTAEALAFTKKYTSVKAGKSKTFKVNIEGAQWKSSDKSIASVSSTGKVKGKKVGKVTITATVGDDKVSTKVKVTPKKIIGIDPGHQQTGDSSTEPIGPGASTRKLKVAGGTRGTATGKPESKLTLEVSKKLKKALEKKGYKVVMTRTKQDVNISNAQRAKKLNKECDIAIRIHADGGASSARGASVLYPSGNNRYVGHLSAKCKKLSQKVITNYCSKTGIRNRGLSVRDDLTGTNWSTIPVTLIELGFMTNATEDRYMSSKSGQKEMVAGIVAGIEAYFE